MNSRLLQKLGVYAIVIALAAVAGAGVVGRLQYASIGIFALCIVGLCIGYPDFAVAALVISAFTVEWGMASGIVPRAAQVVQDLLALAIMAIIIVRARRSDEPIFEVVGGRWLLAFIASGVLGALLSGLAPVTIILALRPVITYVPLAILTQGLRFNKPKMKWLLNLIIGLALIQAPVALYQFLFLKAGRSGDVVGGTLGVFSSGVLTVLMIAMSTLFIGMLLHRYGKRSFVAAALMLCMVPPALNETKVFFVAAPAILSATFLPRMRRNAAGALVVLVLLASTIGMAFQTYQSLYGQTYAGRNAVNALVAQETGDAMAEGGVMKRLPSVLFAVGEVSTNASTFLFGHGAGSLTRSDVVDVQGSLLEQYGTALRSAVWLTRVILEYGFLGLLAFIALLVSAYRAGRKIERESVEPFWRAFGTGMQGVVLTMAVMSVYTGTFTTDGLSCLFWACLGIASRKLYLIKQAAQDQDRRAASSTELRNAAA